MSFGDWRDTAAEVYGPPPICTNRACAQYGRRMTAALAPGSWACMGDMSAPPPPGRRRRSDEERRGCWESVHVTGAPPRVPNPRQISGSAEGS